MEKERGEEAIAAIPKNGKVKGFFNMNDVPSELKEQMSKSHSFNNLLSYGNREVIVYKNYTAGRTYIHINAVKNMFEMFEIYSSNEMYDYFVMLMCYFNISKVLEGKDEECNEKEECSEEKHSEHDPYRNGMNVFASMPRKTNVKGYFKTSELSESLVDEIKFNQNRLVESSANAVSLILKNGENDVIVHIDGDITTIKYPIQDEQAEVHRGTDLWHDLIRLFDVFNIVKDLGPDKEPEKPEWKEKKVALIKHVSDEELYNAMSNIQNYCAAHCHDCETCALSVKVYGVQCFMEAFNVPTDWNLNPPEYRVFR